MEGNNWNVGENNNTWNLKYSSKSLNGNKIESGPLFQVDIN